VRPFSGDLGGHGQLLPFPRPKIAKKSRPFKCGSFWRSFLHSSCAHLFLTQHVEAATTDDWTLLPAAGQLLALHLSSQNTKKNQLLLLATVLLSSLDDRKRLNVCFLKKITIFLSLSRPKQRSEKTGKVVWRLQKQVMTFLGRGRDQLWTDKLVVRLWSGAIKLHVNWLEDKQELLLIN